MRVPNLQLAKGGVKLVVHITVSVAYIAAP
jgi:hypothetical protein